MTKAKLQRVNERTKDEIQHEGRRWLQPSDIK